MTDATPLLLWESSERRDRTMVEHFRHSDGRLVSAVDIFEECDEDGCRMTFRKIEVDGRAPTVEESDELSDDLRDELMRQIDWSH